MPFSNLKSWNPAFAGFKFTIGQSCVGEYFFRGVGYFYPYDVQCPTPALRWIAKIIAATDSRLNCWRGICGVGHGFCCKLQVMQQALMMNADSKISPK